jgi:outer membrane protein TolC
VGNEAESPAVQLRDRTATYSAGVTLDLPVDRVAERNSFRRSLISFQHAERNYEATRDRITADVRDTLRAIRAAELSLDIQRRGIELAQRRVEYATARLLLGGNLSSRDVVEAQTSLLSAQDSYEQAKSVLQIRVLEYMRDTGTLRVDPKAGSIGRAMDRKPSQPTNGPRSDS